MMDKKRKKVEQYIEQYQMIGRGDRIVGNDGTVFAHVRRSAAAGFEQRIAGTSLGLR